MSRTHTYLAALAAALLLCGAAQAATQNGKPACAASSAKSAAPSKTANVPQTVIDSDSLDMVAGEDINTFHFAGNVRAEGQGMILTCDKLDVVARRQIAKATIGHMNSVKIIVATGNVRMEQPGRVATCGKAEMTPDDGLVVMTESPKIVDTKATIEGWKIIYNSHDRTAQVLPTPQDQTQPGQKKLRSHVIIAEQAMSKLDYQQVLGVDKPEGEKKPETPQTATPQPAKAQPSTTTR